MGKRVARSAHFFIVIIGFLIWSVANVLYSICAGLAKIADIVFPNTEYGNCWSFALSRWWTYGGYLMLRQSDENKFLKYFPLPHIFWVKKINLDRSDLEHFVPKSRKRSQFFPWYAIYFDGEIKRNEAPHDAEVPNG